MSFLLTPLNGSKLSGGASGYKLPEGSSLGDIAKRAKALREVTGGKSHFMLRKSNGGVAGGVAGGASVGSPKKGSFVDKVFKSLTKSGPQNGWDEEELGRGANGVATKFCKK